MQIGGTALTRWHRMISPRERTGGATAASCLLWLTAALAPSIGHAAWGNYQSRVWAYSSNVGSDQWYGLTDQAEYAYWTDRNLGTFTIGSGSLYLKGGSGKIWKNGGDNVSGCGLDRKVWRNGDSEPGSYTGFAFSYVSSWDDSGSVNQYWENVSQNIDLIGLTRTTDNGTYYVKFRTYFVGTGTTQYSPDRTANYTWKSAEDVTVSSGSSTDPSGLPTGQLGLNKLGAGELVLNSSKSYTGVTRVKAGTITISASVSSGSDGPMGNATDCLLLGDTTGSSDATFKIDTDSVTMGRCITVRGSSSGSKYIAASGSGTISGEVNVDETVSDKVYVDVSDGKTLTMSGIVNGSGGGKIRKTGGGTLVFSSSGDHTHDKIVQIDAGTLSISRSRHVGADPGSGYEGKITLNGGTLAVTDTMDIHANCLTTVQAASTIDVASTKTLGYKPVISGSAALTKTGAGVLELRESNSHSGTLTVDGGTIRLYAANRISDNSAVVVNGGYTFDMNGCGDKVGSIAGAGSITMGANAQLLAGANNSTTEFSGTISGSGTANMVKQGTGTLTLSGSNTYPGGTYVDAGILKLTASNAAAGSGAIYLGALPSVSANATLRIGAGRTIANGVLSRPTDGEIAIVDTDTGSGNATLSGTLTLTKDVLPGQATPSTHLVNNLSSGNLVIDKISLDSGVNQNRIVYVSGNVVLGGVTNPPSGEHRGLVMRMEEGASSCELTLQGKLNSNFYLDSGNVVWGTGFSLGTSVSEFQVGSTDNATAAKEDCSVSFKNSGTYNVDMLVGFLSPTVGSTGTRMLNFTHSSGNVDLEGSVTFSPTDAVGKELVLQNTNAVRITAGGTVSGPAGLRKKGPGALTFSGTASYQGDTHIDNGTLKLANFSGSGLGTIYLGSATGSENVALYVGDGNSSAVPVVIDDGAGSRTIGSDDGSATYTANVTLNKSADFTVASSKTVTFQTGAVSGSGGVTKTGAGALTLSGANTYSGTTTVNAGTLRADRADGAGNGALGNGGDITFTGGTLQYTAASAGTDWATRFKSSTTAAIKLDLNGQAVTLAGIIPGSNSGGLTLTGTAGTLALSGDNAYTGATAIEAGTLKLTDGSLGNTAITLSGTSTLAVQPGGATDIDAGTTGAGTAGATLTLGSGRTFDMTDGATSAFNLKQQDSFAGTALTLSDGATLKFNLGNSNADKLAVTKAAAVSGTVYVSVDMTGATSPDESPHTIVSAASGLNAGTWRFVGGKPFQIVNVAGTDYGVVLDATATEVKVTAVPASKDTDSDMLPDYWETAYGQSSATGNPDSDSANNLFEFRCNTDPTDAASYLRIMSADFDEVANKVKLTLYLGQSRTFRIKAANSPGGTKVNANPEISQTQEGAYVWTDSYTVPAVDTQRFYEVAVNYGGQDYTNVDEWAAFSQARSASSRYLMCVPVNYGSDSENNFAGELGQHLARGLYATGSTGDVVRFWNTSGQWVTCTVVTNGAGQPVWYTANSPANIRVTPGMAMWVHRSADAAPRPNTVFVGRSFLESQTVSFAFKTNAWTAFGWPLGQKRSHSSSDPGTTQLGFEGLGSGGRVSTTNTALLGDEIWVWKDNTWKGFYSLLDNIGSEWNGRWWDNNRRQLADFSLEPGMGYFYRHRTNQWGGSNFEWQPELP